MVEADRRVVVVVGAEEGAGIVERVSGVGDVLATVTVTSSVDGEEEEDAAAPTVTVSTTGEVVLVVAALSVRVSTTVTRS